ncbi:MAG: hypothetical protein WCJ37_06935 [Syntrophus sp. (in: bacteria)]
MSFVALIRQILRMHPEGMTPRQIREIIKVKYPDFYGTESHRRNVEKGHYKNVDHAVEAQIYSASRTADRIVVDKTQKPLKLTLSLGQGNDVNIADKEVDIGKLERLRAGVVSYKVTMQKPLMPCPSLIAEYLGRWEQLENYRLQETSLGLLFHTLCPENKKIEHVLLKVSALNDFYSTNIFDTYSVARHILAKDIDARLEVNDYSLVNDIAQIAIKAKTINFYSFASKYCSHHKPTSYPIFDSFVEKMMLHYKTVDSFNGFDKVDLKDYERFIQIIKSFQSFYKLEKFSLREIDIFLWLAGKEWFPKKYK